MNAKQIETLLQNAQSVIDDKFSFASASQRTAAKLHVDAIRSARSALSAAAYRNFDAEIKAGNVPAAREWQKIGAVAATISPAKVEMSVDAAIAAIESAIKALEQM